jgi:hypothetical protein
VEIFRVDSRTVSLSNKETLNEKIDYYGPESNYVRSHILGQFPTATTEQLIPLDLIEDAAIREMNMDPTDPVILGCDVASGHGEDSSVIYIRKGLDGRTHPPRKYSNLDTAQFAYKIAAVAKDVNADAIFVDAGGLGEGTAATLRGLGLAPHSVYFGSKADNANGLVRCANKRSEMWCAMAQWLKAGAIVNDDQLKAELAGPEYSENAQGVILERKEDMKARGLGSPDIADALALTFASPVVGQFSFAGRGDHMVQTEYDPFSDAAMTGRSYPEAIQRPYADGWARLKPEYEDMRSWRDRPG